ncbi:hypothetical protein FHS21_006348 [Phyllobacterium trifolii]|uniref:Uncharacterized protein n=1 Tax=Phyllobacterium trifolii TaxID=300193 RepID=A0A839UMR8_9HYPH|nr:hypothetical protein [Phyllobacterium trifolii]
MGRNSHVRGYAPATAYGAKLRLTNVRKWPILLKNSLLQALGTHDSIL